MQNHRDQKKRLESSRMSELVEVFKEIKETFKKQNIELSDQALSAFVIYEVEERRKTKK